MAWNWYMAYALPSGTGGAILNGQVGQGGFDAHNVLEVVAAGAGELGIRAAGTSVVDVWRKNVPDLSEITLGTRWLWQTGGANSKLIFALYNGNTLGLNVRMTTDGVVAVLRGGTLLADNVAELNANTRYWVELSAKIDGTEGDWTLRIDGVEIGSGSSENTGSAAIDNVRGRADGGTAGIGNARGWWGTLYIRERPALEDGFLGPLVPTVLDPDSDVAVDWTPSTGTDNYALVGTPLDIGTYVDSDTATDVDEYTAEDLGAGVNSVVAVLRFSVSEAPNGGSPQIAHGIKRGSTEVYGDERVVGVGGRRYNVTQFETQPNAAPWSVAAVNELRILRKAV
jgi:hypothetical protein